MIGLGSNRLTVCRRGGQDLYYVGGYGGMRLVTSPYSAQATAALKAAFTAAQWPTIRDYGFAHPEIVGYMNAYAPEDAKIAYSLVEGIGTRWIVTSGAAAIDTGLYINVGDYFKMKFQCDNLPASSYNRVTPYGATNRMWMRIERVGTIECCMQSQQNIGSCTFNANTPYEMEINTNGKYKIGSQTFTKNGLTATTPNTMWLFKKAENYNDTYTKREDRYELFDSVGNRRQWLVPFELGVERTAEQVYPSSKGAQAIGTKGMLDVVSGLFHPNAMSSGSFTISETPAS